MLPSLLLVGLVLGVLIRGRPRRGLVLLLGMAAAVTWGTAVGLNADDVGTAATGAALAAVNVLVGLTVAVATVAYSRASRV